MPKTSSDHAQEASDRGEASSVCAQLDAIARIAGKLSGAQSALIRLQVPVSGALDGRTVFGDGLIDIAGDMTIFHAVMASPGGLIVADAQGDARFDAYPLVRFFVGLPMTNDAGVVAGCLCVVDEAPRIEPATELIDDLRAMAKTAATTIELAEIAHCEDVLMAMGGGTAVEQEAAQVNRRFEILADALPQLVWSAPNDGLSDYFNRQWCEFTGAPASESHGTGWLNFLHPDDVPAAKAAWATAIATGEPYMIEYRLMNADGAYRWMLTRGLPVTDESGAVSRWIGTCTDIDDRVRTGDLLEFMSRELSHRIKNMFAVVQGLISMALRKHEGMSQVSQALQLRMVALGRAHDLVRPRFAEGAIMRSQTTLRELIRILTQPYVVDDPGRLQITGGDTVVSEHAATPLALFFHEMAINSAVFGALSVPQGQLSIALSVADDVIVEWRESEGPVIAEPPVPAFGIGLTRLTVERQLGGSLTLDWQPQGLAATARIPLQQLHAE
ncbi:sensor histidine kinase [Novosphingobium sp.]|uniref:sensor histidine kinase n=1 Tax=Novosphingobium sp. TaxID=1874826 RepID=UPI003D0E4318